MGQIRMALLGTPDIRHAGEQLTVPTRKALALLAYLVVDGGAHTREELAGLLWPDSSTSKSRAALRYTLSCLRAALFDGHGGGHLVADKVLAFDFRTSEDLDIDLRTFLTAAGPLQPSETRRTFVARLQHAAGLWRGEFMEGFSIRDAAPFEEWMMGQAEAWRGRMESVLDQLSQTQSDEGLVRQGRETAERWVALSPLNERAHQRAIQLAVAAGDRAGALRAYATCREIVRRELDVEPTPETEAIAHRARSALGISGGEEVGTTRGARTAAFVQAPLVGRADELGRLVEAYYGLRGGHARAAVLEGEAGIGKTRLATEFLAWARAQGADVLAGGAFETGGRVSYQPLVDALRPRVERENAPDDLLSDVWLAALARLLPELGERYPDLPGPGGDETVARGRLFEAVARLGQALAAPPGGPVVLFMDDLHWADAASMDVLRYVARRWTELHVSVLLLLSVRSEAIASDPPLTDWLVALARDLPLARITIGSLEPEDVDELVQQLGISTANRAKTDPAQPRTGVADFARWLFGETNGQPFHVTETLKGLIERGALAPRRVEDHGWRFEIQPSLLDDATRQGILPSGLREVLRARLGRVSPAAGKLLTAAAVLGQSCSFERLVHVAELDEDEALPALDEALKGLLLREVGTTYLFAHDKIRDVVYAEAGEARRRVFHRRALEAMQRAGGSAAERAHQAVGADLDEPAFELSIAAGDEAMRLLAARDAVEHYRRSRAIAARRNWTERLADLHIRFGKAFVSLAQWADARRELESALKELGRNEEERRAEVLVDLAVACWWLLDLDAMGRYGNEALTLAERCGRGDLATTTMAVLAGGDSAAGNLSSAIDRHRRARARALELGIPPPTHMLPLASSVLYWLGRLEDAAESSREAIRLAREVHDPSMMMFALPHLGLALAGRGDYGEAIEVFAEARRYGLEYGVGTLHARAIAMSAGFRRELFDYAGAQAVAEEARELALGLNFPPPAVSSGIDLILNFASRDEIGRADALLPEVVAAVEKAADWHGWLWGLRLAEARAEMAFGRRDWDGALDWATRTIEQCRLRGRLKYEAMGLTTRGRALAATGRTPEARADLESAVGLARRIGDPALFLRGVSVLLGVDGNDALAAEAHDAVQRILAALTDETIRQAFEAAEPIRAILRFARLEPARGSRPDRRSALTIDSRSGSPRSAW